MITTSSTRSGIENTLCLVRAATRLGDDCGLVTGLAELQEQNTRLSAWYTLHAGAICYVKNRNKNYSLRLIDCNSTIPPFEKWKIDLPEDMEFKMTSRSSFVTFTTSEGKSYALNFKSDTSAEEFLQKANKLQHERREKIAKNKGVWFPLMRKSKSDKAQTANRKSKEEDGKHEDVPKVDMKKNSTKPTFPHAWSSTALRTATSMTPRPTTSTAKQATPPPRPTFPPQCSSTAMRTSSPQTPSTTFPHRWSSTTTLSPTSRTQRPAFPPPSSSSTVLTSTVRTPRSTAPLLQPTFPPTSSPARILTPTIRTPRPTVPPPRPTSPPKWSSAGMRTPTFPTPKLATLSPRSLPGNRSGLYPRVEPSAPPECDNSEPKAPPVPRRGPTGSERYARVSGAENTRDGQIELAIEMGYSRSEILQAFASVLNNGNGGAFWTVDDMIQALSLVQQVQGSTPTNTRNGEESGLRLKPSAPASDGPVGNASSDKVRLLEKRMEEIKKELDEARLEHERHLAERVKKTEKELDDARSKLKDVPTCIVCLDEKPDVVFTPCSHFVCCGSCASALDTCPVCRQRIRGKMKVYQ